MPPLRLLRGFLALWLITGLVVLALSVGTVYSALGAARHPAPHLAVLGSIEAIGALLFLVPRTVRWGAGGLLATLAAALALHALLGQFRGDLLVYGAVVAFVAVHGPLTREQFHAALRGGRVPRGSDVGRTIPS